MTYVKCMCEDNNPELVLQDSQKEHEVITKLKKRFVREGYTIAVEADMYRGKFYESLSIRIPANKQEVITIEMKCYANDKIIEANIYYDDLLDMIYEMLQRDKKTLYYQKDGHMYLFDIYNSTLYYASNDSYVVPIILVTDRDIMRAMFLDFITLACREGNMPCDEYLVKAAELLNEENRRY